ncbi:hypothetical protein [Methanonatronarchaeum thermophilum]|uniref:hypothetical protein n=1 Tax=Methanonatronarchaeum thermophilum TaxID=1927129 RepID=UPI00191BA50C|nr:hypothetical protein [Methanonatronarchaeum thermophilum]
MLKIISASGAKTKVASILERRWLKLIWDQELKTIPIGLEKEFDAKGSHKGLKKSQNPL